MKRYHKFRIKNENGGESVYRMCLDNLDYELLQNRVRCSTAPVWEVPSSDFGHVFSEPYTECYEEYVNANIDVSLRGTEQKTAMENEGKYYYGETSRRF